MKKEEKTEWKKYLILWNDIEVGKEIPYDLGNYIVRKPDKRMINGIASHFRGIMGGSERNPFQESIFKQEGKSLCINQIKNSEDFRYLIVESKNIVENNLKKISQAFRLTPDDLWAESSFHVSEFSETIQFRPDQVGNFFGIIKSTKLPPKVDWSTVTQIVNLRDGFKDDDYPNVVGSIQLFIDNDAIPDKSILKHLGYFAIIESLLSHNPTQNDSVDSIRKQLTRNLILLNNRKEGYVDLMMTLFDGVKPDILIKKLYDYRSNIAHGGRGESQLEELFQLKKKNEQHEQWNLSKKQWIAWYIRTLTKGVLLHALKEPQLINDLK